MNFILFTPKDIEDNIGLLGCPGIFLSLFICLYFEENEEPEEKYDIFKRIALGVTLVSITFFIVANIELHFLVKNILCLITHLWIQKYSTSHFKLLKI